MSRHLFAVCAATAFALTAVPANAQIEGIPRYEHIIVIIAENHGYEQIIGKTELAPNINTLAEKYGLARKYYCVAHPSKANYIAMIAGKTFGIHDDAPYVDHTLSDRSLVDQLAARNLTWKGYYESIPAADPRKVYFPDPPKALYASKHNAFINFKSVQDDPALADKIVGFDRLFADLGPDGQFPNYAHIVPNLCNDMHGMDPGPDVDKDCEFDDSEDTGLIARGDKMIGDLVAKIIASPIWSKPGNVAIVITWDENEDGRNVEGQGLLWVPADQRGQLRRRQRPDHRRHQPRAAWRHRRHAAQSLFAVAHDRGRVRHHRVPGARQASRRAHDGQAVCDAVRWAKAAQRPCPPFVLP